GSGAARGEPGDDGLEQTARLEELPDRLALRQHHHGQRLDQRLHGDLAHERALTGSDLDEAQTLPRAEGFAHRGPADHEFLRRVAFGWELIAALEAPLRDHRFDLPDDLLVDAGRLDGLDAHLGAGLAGSGLAALRAAHTFSGTWCRRVPRLRHQPMTIS